MTTELHIATFNAENFSLLLDRDDYTREDLDALPLDDYRAMNTSIYNPNKDRRKIARIARIIQKEDFDIVGLCEIGGMETLEAFNRIYLDGEYIPLLHEENSKRGIFVGALVKKGIFEHVAAKNMGNDFSRNLLRLRVRTRADYLDIFVVHLKSQRGDDFGIDERAQEIGRLASLVGKKRTIVMGDFNGIAIRTQNQFEFEPLLELPLTDVLAAVGIPPGQRHTHYYFGNGTHFSQLDYMFCTHDIHIMDASVIEEAVPRNREERYNLPSDHLFLRARIEIESEDI